MIARCRTRDVTVLLRSRAVPPEAEHPHAENATRLRVHIDSLTKGLGSRLHTMCFVRQPLFAALDFSNLVPSFIIFWPTFNEHKLKSLHHKEQLLEAYRKRSVA